MAKVFIHGQNEFAGIAALNAVAQGATDIEVLAGNDARGGMFSSGLLGADGIGGLTGIAMQYFRNIGLKYGMPSTVCGAPSMNLTVFNEMLAAANITIRPGYVASVVKSNTAITRVLTTQGATINIDPGGVCVEADSIGDLARLAGCELVHGREELSADEPTSGFGVIAGGYTQSPYAAGGGLKPGILPFPKKRRIGGSDKSIQGWNFRVPILEISKGGIPFVQPPGYDPANYDWYNTIQRSTGEFTPPVSRTYADLGGSAALPAYYDTNFVDIPGVDKTLWCTGTPADRAALYTYAMNWLLGYFWFNKTHATVWPPRRDWWGLMGLCPGEFTGNGNFPPQFYTRATNRLKNPVYKMRQRDLQWDTVKANPIAFGRNSLDQHVHAMYANAPGNRATGVIYEGRMGSISIEAKTVSRYHIPYESLLPADGPRNLICCGFVIGASANAYSSQRMTGTGLENSQAAGIAAGYAAMNGKRLSDIGRDVSAMVAALT